MAFLPFYIPENRQLKIAILGGGYAGISAMTSILRYMPEAIITLIDPRSQHVKITHLHETFRYPLEDILMPFAALEERFGCRHVCTELTPQEDTLYQWQNAKSISLGDQVIEFDYLLIASGAAGKKMDVTPDVVTLQDFISLSGADLLSSHLDASSAQDQPISVIGGGATGIQFLFEIALFLRRKKLKNRLRLVDGGDRVLKQFPEGFSSYTQSRMNDQGIDFHPNTLYHGQVDGRIFLEERGGRGQFDLPSSMSFMFLGKKPENIFPTNTFGQVLVNEFPLENIFAAGDCSSYNKYGSNVMSAQSAVRKGKLCARNILRHSGRIKVLEPYLHRDLGYVVNLGPSDAVGWLATEGNVVTGMPALAIKEVVEIQYDLLLTGTDTYLI
jgi:NADH dehydrogenase